ncbi:MAG TPA: response regulator, partial [Gammaproteobacteria bacterium]
ALETLESEPDIALILMDIAMPVKDGYTTIQQIRNMPGISEIPVITMSCDDTNREHAVEGAKDHIHKPIDPDILQQTIERYIA